jgi:hypothetical protein
MNRSGRCGACASSAALNATLGNLLAPVLSSGIATRSSVLSWQDLTTRAARSGRPVRRVGTVCGGAGANPVHEPAGVRPTTDRVRRWVPREWVGRRLLDHRMALRDDVTVANRRPRPGGDSRHQTAQNPHTDAHPCAVSGSPGSSSHRERVARRVGVQRRVGRFGAGAWTFCACTPGSRGVAECPARRSGRYCGFSASFASRVLARSRSAPDARKPARRSTSDRRLRQRSVGAKREQPAGLPLRPASYPAGSSRYRNARGPAIPRRRR